MLGFLFSKFPLNYISLWYHSFLPPPSLFLQEGLKHFKCWQKGLRLALFKFLGGGVGRKEGFDFFKGGGEAEDFLEEFPNCSSNITEDKKNVNYSNNDNDNAVYLLTNFKLSPICKLKTFHEYEALISIKFANKGSIIRKTS